MLKALLRCALLAFALLPVMATAAPIELKFSFFTSDRSTIYQNSIKPFVDAVNNEGEGLIEIKVYFSGAISAVQALQPQLVAEDTADMALVVPAQSPENSAIRRSWNCRAFIAIQAKRVLVFTRLIEAGALEGYADFFVIGAFVSGPESIHSRIPIAVLEDLKGLTIRTNNKTEAAALQKLGAIPVLLAINQATDAINRGKIDAATFPPSLLFEFGIGRVANNHLMIYLGGVPTALVMNRNKFVSLPPAAQAIIRKYSGRWLAERSVARFGTLDEQVLEQLKSDPKRKVSELSAADLASTQLVFASVSTIGRL